MGQILLRALVDSKVATRQSLWAVTKTAHSARTVSRNCGVKCYTEAPEQLLRKAKIIFLAVKPAQARSTLNLLKRRGLSSKTLIISVVTGVTCSQLEAEVPNKTAVIRVMTNTACRVKQGVSLIVAGHTASIHHIKTAQKIFGHLGTVMQVEEQYCDALTGLAASGPAYIFLIIEALADGGVNVGLPRELALKVAAQTVLGASQMVLHTGRHPASLRDEVTTPAGCTIAALLIMEDGKLRSILGRAIEEATRVARTLGQARDAN